MEKQFLDILTSMEAERDLYRELMELSTKKTNIILNKELKELENLVEREQEYIVRIGQLELEREELLEELAKAKAIEPREITLSTLMEWTEGDVRDQFQGLQRDFARIIDRQKQLNEINSKLIRTNLEYIDFAINLMTGEGSSGHIYERKGQVSKGSQSINLFDTKA